VSAVRFPDGFRLEPLRRDHPRKGFRCGEERVDDWLTLKALQSQEKRLSVTKILLDEAGAIAGFYTLATSQIDFKDLPAELTTRLPRRALPVAVLAWLGVGTERRRQGLGRLLLAQALRDCFEAGKTFALIAVVLDCLSDAAKAFYQQWDFQELSGHPYRLFLSAKRLEALMQEA
jgi:GNAT superfamily N-acetyltransferase